MDPDGLDMLTERGQAANNLQSPLRCCRQQHEVRCLRRPREAPSAAWTPCPAVPQHPASGCWLTSGSRAGSTGVVESACVCGLFGLIWAAPASDVAWSGAAG